MKESLPLPPHADWLPVILEGSTSEIYVIDCDALRFIYANPAALHNLRYNMEELQTLSPVSIVPAVSSTSYREWLLSLLQDEAALSVKFDHVRKDGSCYPIECRLFRLTSGNGNIVIAIGNDVSLRDQSNQALQASESRLNAILSNTPGLVYQFCLDPQGNPAFPYLSEGCEALLGIDAEILQTVPSLFSQLILDEDRPSYLESMQFSMTRMSSWNWEGRIHIHQWNDIKWINLRATPRQLDNGIVQWEGIMTNITSGKLELEEIRRSRAQITELSAHINTVKEKERTRISREIHDDLGGNLTAIKMALALLTRRLPASDKLLMEKAEYVDQLVDRTIETVHRIAGDLRPGVLDFGLIAALEWQAREFEKQTGISCHLGSNKAESEINVDPDLATALFRIFQETLTNIAKHAQASAVEVSLVHEETEIWLKVTDNGRGIQSIDKEKPDSFGIRGMAERARALGGTLSITTPPQGGTMVTIHIPLSDNKNPA